MFPGFITGGVLQPFIEHPDNRESNLIDISLYGRSRQVDQPQDHYHQQRLQTQQRHHQRLVNEVRSGVYAEDYFPAELHQFQADSSRSDAQTLSCRGSMPVDGPSENFAAKQQQQAKDMSWEKVRKMNSYRLRTLPLDMLHVLDEGRQRRLRVAPLEGQARKIEALEVLDDQNFVSKCLDPLDLRCDCCDVNFCGTTKLRAMLEHIQTQQHFTTFRTRMLEDPLYAYRMNKTTVIPPSPSVQNPTVKKKVAVVPNQVKKPVQSGVVSIPTEEGPQASKKIRKHPEIPEEYRAMADWLACYVCNITCSSLGIYESHAIGKRHQRLLLLAPPHVQNLPWGPYLIDGKPTIDTGLGGVKIAIQGGQYLRIGGEQPQLSNPSLQHRIREFVHSKLGSKTEV